MPHHTSVLVIGGGYSGALTAAHLARRGIPTTVIEPGALGRGVAYAASAASLLLNTPASAMSALPGAPHHFEAWLERSRTATDARPQRGPGVQGIDRPDARTAVFAPRARYGDYLEHTITELAQGQLDVVRARATSVEATLRGFAVRCDDGNELAASRLVLALGNAPPRTPAAIRGPLPGYLADPYAGLGAIEPRGSRARDSAMRGARARGLAAIGDRDPVAILGTGLTALDVIAGLRARGHRGSIVCASRRGLLPTAYRASPRLELHVPRELVRSPRLHRVLAWWRDCVHGHRDAEPSVVAALRPLIPTIWRRLPIADRARFLRDVRPRWDVVRHRAPPSVRAVVDLGVAEGSIEILSAQLGAVEPLRSGLRCRFVTASGATHSHDVRWIVNCTGPERDVRRMRAPLVQSLRERGMLASDPFGLGVLTTPSGQLVGETGPIPGAFVVGPWRIADLWESTAIPELRDHAAATAAALDPNGDPGASAKM